MNKIICKYKVLPVQAKATFWFLVCSFFQKGISMLTTPIFTRLLTPSEYGQFNVFNSWLGIITIFVSLNLSYGVYTQGLIKFDNDKSVFSSSLQGLTIVLVFFWTGVYFLFQDFWNKLFGLSTSQMVAMLVMIWTTAVFSFWSSEQRVLYRYKMLVIITAVVAVAKPVVGIVLVKLANDKVLARILGLLLVEIIAYPILFFLQVNKGRQLFSFKYWKYALAFNLPLVPHYLSQTVLNSADRIMIDNMVNDRAAGIYSLAYSISLIMTLFNTALAQATGPWIYQKIKEKREKDIASIAYLTLICIAAVNVLLIAFAPEIVKLFAPKEYYEAIWVIPPIAISTYFMYSYDLYAKFAFYYEKTKTVMGVSVIGAVLNIILNYYFIGKYGYLAAGYTTLICYIVYCIGHYVFMNIICENFCEGRKPYDTRIILLISSVFVCIGFSLLTTYKSLYVRYILIGIILFLVCLFRRKILKYLKLKCQIF